MYAVSNQEFIFLELGIVSLDCLFHLTVYPTTEYNRVLAGQEIRYNSSNCKKV